MAFGDLREFIAHLEKHGWLRRVSAPVSRDLEIAEITDRVSKSAGGRNVALLFESVRGSEMPVLINAFGSRERMAAALGVERLDELSARVAKLLDLRMPGSVFEKLRKLGDLFDLVKAGPKRVRSAPCQEVVETDHPSLAGLPILRCWPGDGGPVHHAAHGLHAGPRHRRAQRGDVPAPGVRRPDPRHALADPQGLRRAPAPGRGAPRADGGGHRAGRRPVRDLLGLRAATARRRRDGVRGLAARLGRAHGAVQDRPHRRAGRGRDRARGLGRPGRAAARGALRRPHRLLLARARLPGVPPQGGDAAEEPDLPDHHRGAPAAGGLLAGQGHRAHLPAHHPDDAARGGGHEHAGRGRSSTTS